jgi:hypothetical protein
MPRQQIASDNFNRADETLGSPNWQQIKPSWGTVDVVSNKVRATSAIGEIKAAGWIANSFSDDQYAEVVLDPTGIGWNTQTIGGVGCRWNGLTESSASMYEAIWFNKETPELRIVKLIAGTSTVLASKSYSPGSPFTLALECEGSTLRLLVNGTTELTATDTQLASGRPAVLARTDSSKPLPTVDDWSAGNITSGGQDVAIIQFKRGTRAQIDSAASSNQLRVAEPYLLTDENRMALGLSVNSYTDIMMRGLDQTMCWPIRTATPKIAGDLNGTALSTITMTASRQYWIPLVVARKITLTGLRVSVTTAATGAASIGIYSNRVVSGSDEPDQLLASVTGLDTGSTGDKTGTLSYTLQPGTIYWASVICAAAATLRALAEDSVQPALGRTVNNTTMITHLYASGSGSTLASPAPATFTAGTGVAPAIYLVGS